MVTVHDIIVEDYVYAVLMLRGRSYIKLEDKKDSVGESLYNIGDFLNVKEVVGGKSTGRSFISEIKNITQEGELEENIRVLTLKDWKVNWCEDYYSRKGRG